MFRYGRNLISSLSGPVQETPPPRTCPHHLPDRGDRFYGGHHTQIHHTASESGSTPSPVSWPRTSHFSLLHLTQTGMITKPDEDLWLKAGRMPGAYIVLHKHELPLILLPMRIRPFQAFRLRLLSGQAWEKSSVEAPTWRRASETPGGNPGEKRDLTRRTEALTMQRQACVARALEPV